MFIIIAGDHSSIGAIESSLIGYSSRLLRNISYYDVPSSCLAYMVISIV